MKKIEQLEKRINKAIAHYEEHKVAFETLSQKLASYNGIRAEVLEEVKGWIVELRNPVAPEEFVDTKAGMDTEHGLLAGDLEKNEVTLENQETLNIEEIPVVVES